ncbi:hypothetical protein P6709_09500 [Jeotgalibacillus sp. ET6]|uniref:hypothetical protein n=1 Tax=Jeotgalibacillus sp. ET6 TaxID=3037260 RepID=UPI0024182173|nr:hypothetical protein [Jeotgalibacillus sp. ET6]MDG5471984.1 hypothetical protein [Jeotgalibacillus sp. ET6]
MNNLTYTKNELTIQGKTVTLEKNIHETKMFKDTVIVIFTPDGTLDNVIGLDMDGNQLWQIQDPGDELAGKRRFPYVGISSANDQLGVTDFYGRRFFIDPSTGEFVGKDIVK